MADFSALCEATLISQLATGTTSGVTVQLKKVNGVYSTVTWPTGAHEIMLVRQTEDGLYAERIVVASGTTQSNTTGVVTLGTLTRNCSLTDGTDTTGSSATITWPASTKVYVPWGIRDAERTAFKNEANTFTTHQTLDATSELRLNSSATAVWKDGSGNLSFKDANQATRTLSQLASASGSNDKFKVSSDDTTENYASIKLTGGDGISVTETNGGGNETLDFDVDLASNPGLEFSSGALRVKESTGITRDSNGISVNQSALTSVPTTNKTVYLAAGDSAAAGASSTSDFDFDTHQPTLDASTIVSNAGYEFVAVISLTWAAGDIEVYVKLGTTKILTFGDTTPTGSTTILISGQVVGTAAAGASVTVRALGESAYIDGATYEGFRKYTATGAIATNGTLAFKIGGAFRTSNGSNNMVLRMLHVRRIASTAF